MNDELLDALGREQRDDLERPTQLADEGSPAERPFEDSERASIVEAVFDQIDQAAPAHETSDVVELPRHRRRWVTIAAAVAAAAAAVLLWTNLRPKGGDAAAVPPYTITQMWGDVATVRSDAEGDAVLRFFADAEVDWVVTPQRIETRAVALAILADPIDGSQEAVLATPVPAAASTEGALRLRGPLSHFIALTPGRWQLSLYIAPPDQLPASVTAAKAGGAWRVVERTVEIVPASE